MTPAARVQAAIELLDQVIEAARGNGAPADRIVADGLRARRYAGSKDRRAIRDLAYAAIRACGPLPESGRAAMLRLAGLDAPLGDLFDGSAYGPAPVEPGEPVAQFVVVDGLGQFLGAIHAGRLKRLPAPLHGIEGRVQDHAVRVQVRVQLAAGVVPKRGADDVARKPFGILPAFADARLRVAFEFPHGRAHGLVVQRDDPRIAHQSDH